MMSDALKVESVVLELVASVILFHGFCRTGGGLDGGEYRPPLNAFLDMKAEDAGLDFLPLMFFEDDEDIV